MKNSQQEKDFPISINYKKEEKQCQLHIVPKLPFFDYSATVEEIAGSLYVKGEYKPYLKQYVFCAAVLGSYTDYPGGFKPDEILDLCQTTDLFPKLISALDPVQYESLKRDVEDLVAYRNGNAERNSFFRELRELLAHSPNDAALTSRILESFLSVALDARSDLKENRPKNE